MLLAYCPLFSGRTSIGDGCLILGKAREVRYPIKLHTANIGYGRSSGKRNNRTTAAIKSMIAVVEHAREKKRLWTERKLSQATCNISDHDAQVGKVDRTLTIQVPFRLAGGLDVRHRDIGYQQTQIA